MAEKRMFMRDIFESSIMHGLGENNPKFELEAQRVFEALILSADDYGRGRLIYQNIRVKAFGSTPNRYAAVNCKLIKGWVKQIEEQGAIQVYEFDGENYYYLTGWNKYQDGKWYKRDSKLPAPPGISDQSSENSREKVKQVKSSKEKKKKEDKKRNKAETAEEKTLRKELIAFCRKIVPKKCGIAAQLKKQVDALLNLITSDQDKIDIERLYTAETWKEHVFAVLEWARNDTEGSAKWRGWSSVFQSISRLRDEGCDKFINMREAYLSANKKKKKKTRKIDDPSKFKKTGSTKL